MELPNYCRQLMQQLQALRQEKRFCDCAILVGDTAHHAHKHVLAASSMLFRSVLEGSDSISIDTELLSSPEFSALLDLVYTGKLPPGKHNLSRLISAADSLQMFDVAVGCKNILTDLMRRTSEEAERLKDDVERTPQTSESSLEDESAREFISRNQDGVSKVLQSVKPFVGALQTWDALSEKERQALVELFDGDSAGHELYLRLLSRVEADGVLSAGKIWKLLKHVNCEIGSDEEDVSCPNATDGAGNVCGSDGSTEASSSNLSELLTGAVKICSSEEERKVVLDCCAAASSSEELMEMLKLRLEEKSLSEETFALLLREVKENPSDQLLKETRAEQEEAVDSEEGGRRYSCEWCGKLFHFKCRLIKHQKACALSPARTQRCPQCSASFPTLKSLQQHRSHAHHTPPAPKRRRHVTCDMCDKTFKHASGLIYHRRTEHFEQKPFACEECGSTFSAASSLKNHARLHSGEKPFHCRHCPMRFPVAAALAYHSKKKHAEGKMYSCQYCSAAFAQSIELTRHIRTHTGDQPYVCRECGKGFKQANGLSVHLRKCHDVSAPHDCQKCCVSFSSVDELRQHLQQTHQNKLFLCSACSKIFSSQAALHKHTSVHHCGKPYACNSCHKSYQTLSGLWYHNRTVHPELSSAHNSHALHVTTEWKCVSCDVTLTSEPELQAHVCTATPGHAPSFSCTLCSLHFLSEPELQQHFLSKHMPAPEEEAQTTSTTSVEEVEASEGSGLVELNMEDLLSGRVTLVCQEQQ